MISSTNNEDMSSGNDEKEMQRQNKAAGGKTNFRYELRKFRKDCKNFATIAKISQS